MAEEFKTAWHLYLAGTGILLISLWWLMRNWGWTWFRRGFLLLLAVLLLVPGKGTQPDAPMMPALPLYIYQLVFEEEASAEVAANLVFASAGAFAVLLLWALGAFTYARHRERRKVEE